MSSLESRLHKLEQKVDALEKKLGRVEESRESSSTAPDLEMLQLTEKSTSKEPVLDETFWEEKNASTISIDPIGWFREEPLMKIGAILLILGLAWFVRYAFVQNWVGPAGRITLGISFATLLMIFGAWVQEKNNQAGQVLLGTGLVINLISIYAARSLYDIFTPGLALGLMVVFIAATAVIAVMKNKQSIAVMALLAGMIAPLLTNSPEPSYIFLLTYIALLNTGVFVLVALRKWSALYVLSAFYTVCFSPIMHEVSNLASYIFMGIFALQFYATITVNAIVGNDADTFELISSTTLLITLLIWITEFTPEPLHAFITWAIALVLLIITIGLFGLGKKAEKIAFLHLGAAIAYIVAATSFALEGETFKIALMVETLAFMLISAYVIKHEVTKQIASGLMLVPVMLALPSLSPIRWTEELLTKDFALVAIVTACSIVAALVHYAFYQKSKHTDDQLLGRIFAGIAWLFSTMFIWYSFINILGDTGGTRAIVLVIYAVLGAILLFAGLNTDKLAAKHAGFGILICVILRLLFVDVWNMDLAARIVTFIVVGALLISTAFFQKHLRE